MLIKELFQSDVTRDIPPVVYFHEQTPAKLADEVGEYIVTGGYPDDHPHHQRVPDGIHEQYVSLLTGIVKELDRNGGADLPASWISGFYGSGKSSFAKLLGLALDGAALPDGRSLAEALLARDTSPRAKEFKEAWRALRQRVDPIAVVFDIGGLARDNEHIHSAVVRQVQKRLGYCSTQPLVAEFELDLERDGEWQAFEAKAAEVLGRPWSDVKDNRLGEDLFSQVLHALWPERYTDPMSWVTARAGTFTQSSAAKDATEAIADMLRFRAKDRTLFIVVDEVSQYIHQDEQRMLKLQSFVSELGQRLKGNAWLLVTGQQKLDEADETKVLGKLKDRFKPRLRVHLAPTNIRDVVHKRLLQKTSQGADALRELFRKHRNDLKLFAYGCEDITEEDFVEVYPMLPGHIGLLLEITTALRTRSTRSQGDDQAIRGLLQLLGELFRSQRLAEKPVGALATLDQIYEVQRTALESDVQTTMARILKHCADKDLPLAERAAKAVALLELIQETVPTDAELVARCLYDRLDRGSQADNVVAALEQLRRANLLGYSEKQGYKIQSSSGEEWERERRDIGVPREELIGLVQESLRYLVSLPGPAKLEGRSFPWMACFSDNQRARDVILHNARDPANVTVDLRMLPREDRTAATWVNRSTEKDLENRIVWVAGDPADIESLARDVARSSAMVKRYKPRRDSLPNSRKRLLLDEESNTEELTRRLQAAVDTAWTAGRIYFRGQQVDARELGATFATALGKAAERFIHDLYANFLATQLSPKELEQLLENPLPAGLSPKYVEELKILSLDAGKYEPSCEGVAPQRVLEFIRAEQAVSGASLLEAFGGPPYGYTPSVVRACAIGLLRAGKVTIEPDGGQKLTSVRDAGARDVFEKDRDFKRATLAPAGEIEIDAKDRNRICRLFRDRLRADINRENEDIADAVSQHFPVEAQRLRDVLHRLNRIPRLDAPREPVPHALAQLELALESAIRVVRRTLETVKAVKRHLDALNEGFEQLAAYDAELTDESIDAVREAFDVDRYHLAQLEAFGEQSSELREAGRDLREQLRADRPWRDVAAIAPHLALVRTTYGEARRQILAGHLELAESVRARIMARDGFATLTADETHQVLRPIADALPTTDEDAVAPALVDLQGGVERELARAEEQANDRLDELLSQGKEPAVRKVELRLHNRVVASEPELEALLDELRERIAPELRAGRRVRLVD